MTWIGRIWGHSIVVNDGNLTRVSSRTMTAFRSQKKRKENHEKKSPLYCSREQWFIVSLKEWKVRKCDDEAMKRRTRYVSLRANQPPECTLPWSLLALLPTTTITITVCLLNGTCPHKRKFGEKRGNERATRGCLEVQLRPYIDTNIGKNNYLILTWMLYIILFSFIKLDEIITSLWPTQSFTPSYFHMV